MTDPGVRNENKTESELDTLQEPGEKHKTVLSIKLRNDFNNYIKFKNKRKLFRNAAPLIYFFLALSIINGKIIGVFKLRHLF